MRGNRVAKLDSSALEAFHSPNLSSLATMDISINVNYESIFRSSEVAPFSIHENLCRNVLCCVYSPQCPSNLFEPYSERPPKEWFCKLSEIAGAVRRGCLVINVSQCVKGYVNLNYANGKIVADAGVIPGSDMTTEAALTKLAYVLSKDEWDPVTKNMMMQRNIRGELTVTRSEHLDELDIIPRLAKFLCVTSSAENRLLRNALFPPLVCHAAHANDVRLLENLRLSGANVTSVDYNSRTALHVAAAAGSLEAVVYLLKHGVSVHARDSRDENAMMSAVRSRNLGVIKAILQAGGQIVASSPRIGRIGLAYEVFI
uniref:asparaginase n=1 Tax=Ditylenchus dipsaci TaxID=166011 RepID=A0A915ESN0_9BILA